MDDTRGEDTVTPIRLTQQFIARHLDLNERNVRDFLGKVGLDHKQATLDEIRVAYIRHLREQAAGRMGTGETGLVLADQRARLAKEQADKQEMDNQERRRELIPAGVVMLVLSEIASRLNPVLDTIPARLSLACKGFTAEAKDIVQKELAAIRNEFADFEFFQKALSDGLNKWEGQP